MSLWKGSEDKLFEVGGGRGPGKQGRRTPSSLSTSWVLAPSPGGGGQGGGGGWLASKAAVPFLEDRRTLQGRELGVGMARREAEWGEGQPLQRRGFGCREGELR